MNNNTTELKGREFNGKYYPKIKRIVTAPRKKIRSKLRGFLPLNLEKFIETLPIRQPISRLSSGLNPGI
ncbi:hypothetical protein OQX63_05920 [Pedobacter sp. PF22-3]|uniref:hypothetical protein n=1 Tax=Pedobacter sp. PF22-3 TaxID=2994467 RepID=UPI002245B919|nr:hypothetical protein [Pedobacter sp. PF22-3]MCX2492999.1 hypothetical protein [Pedobacter sp. PF22-3]